MSWYVLRSKDGVYLLHEVSKVRTRTLPHQRRKTVALAEGAKKSFSFIAALTPDLTRTLLFDEPVGAATKGSSLLVVALKKLKELWVILPELASNTGHKYSISHRIFVRENRDG